MTEIYIAFVDTPGIFASIIRRVIKQKYIHVAIGLDENLDEAYSIGRRHPSIPLIAGFEKEEKRKILRAFPGADYMICSIPCTQEQKQFIKEELHEAMKNRSLSLYNSRTSVFTFRKTVLSKKSLHMFFLCCRVA